ncbi:PAAR domain-containing protein [Chelatococcus asaccharovorans]|uniref:PAAR motif-containing protein n=1 Tax=Chelatococcus asaccharovorans TaxID=28210 RepID=A0A2V3UNE0_9HYPH|nr:PAAR domain-containing protein [Chelatococcus asaccharovorans]MBS7703317.1 PAAR domain-containing protein [Chelatococcus asaccharovorans]PXW61650.1 PAAR motif-containing protein [Chelatococcus asaccharovorans]
MHGIARRPVDIAGGNQLSGQQHFVFSEGFEVVVLGDLVQAHGFPPHSPPPPMVHGSPFVFINAIPVCREGHQASCGHATSGSPLVFLET